MIDPIQSTSRYQALRTSQRVLGRMAPLVRFGLFALGISLFLDQVRPMISDAQFTWGERRVMGLVALITLGGFGLAGWVTGRLLGVSAELVEVFIDGTEAAARTADLVERHVVPALGRMAGALERLAAGAREEERARAVAAVRQAIQEGRWRQAERLVQVFTQTALDPSAGAALTEELAQARQGAIDDLRARLNAARKAGDPERVIALRDALTEHLRGDALRDLDRQVARWLMDRIQEQVQAGTIHADLAAWVARAADSFGDTAEGAGFRAALPSLRRSAGLCPRCARPYPGTADACPHCLAAGVEPSSRSPSDEPTSKVQR